VIAEGVQGTSGDSSYTITWPNPGTAQTLNESSITGDGVTPCNKITQAGTDGMYVYFPNSVLNTIEFATFPPVWIEDGTNSPNCKQTLLIQS
jgi:hypothetical protein